MKTGRVQRIVRMYSILAVILIAIIITIIAVYPLYSKLRDTEQQGLVFARDTSVLIVDEYVSRIKDIARQISSRTKASMLLEEYERGDITKDNMQKFLSTILKAALKNSTQLIGITRLNNKNEIISLVGKPVPEQFLLKRIKSDALTLYGPFTWHKHYYVVIVSPIFSPKKKHLGSDMTLFDITDLQASIHQKMQNRLGEILIAYLHDNKIDVFSPIDTQWRNLLNPNNVLSKSLINAIGHKQHGLRTGSVGGKDVFIAYSPVQQSSWGIAVIIKKSALFASIKKILWSIIGTIVVIVILFVVGLSLCLQPLTGKLILHTQELEDKISDNQKELNIINQKLQYSVGHDFLTDVLNRRGFDEALDRELSSAKRHGTSFALLYIDINYFKLVNDEMGHDAGDYLLKELTALLEISTRQEDIIARLGGDEFAVIAPDVDKNQALLLAKKIDSIVNTPLIYHDKELTLSVSLGLAHFPDDGTDKEALLKVSDQNMYDDKMRKK